MVFTKFPLRHHFEDVCWFQRWRRSIRNARCSGFPHGSPRSRRTTGHFPRCSTPPHPTSVDDTNRGSQIQLAMIFSCHHAMIPEEGPICFDVWIKTNFIFFRRNNTASFTTVSLPRSVSTLDLRILWNPGAEFLLELSWNSIQLLYLLLSILPEHVSSTSSFPHSRRKVRHEVPEQLLDAIVLTRFNRAEQTCTYG